jgi:LuxR family maltose regulon positive regulatory protein
MQAVGDTRQALTSLEQSLTLAEPRGFLFAFVTEGPPMARLLYEALSRELSPDYVQKLLAAFPDVEPEKSTKNQAVVSDSEWIEPLSERELEVLQLIAEGLSRQEIATKLVLSLNTVKTHSRNIYGKLRVNNQMQAVGKARGLGLLDKD